MWKAASTCPSLLGFRTIRLLAESSARSLAAAEYLNTYFACGPRCSLEQLVWEWIPFMRPSRFGTYFLNVVVISKLALTCLFGGSPFGTENFFGANSNSGVAAPACCEQQRRAKASLRASAAPPSFSLFAKVDPLKEHTVQVLCQALTPQGRTEAISASSCRCADTHFHIDDTFVPSNGQTA